MQQSPEKNSQEKSWSAEQHEKFLKEFRDIKEIWPKLTEREKKMVVHLAKSENITHNVNQEYEEKRTITEKVADKITQIFGSIYFAAGNALFFVGWITVNLDIIPNIKPFDAYPFGLLTMIVSLEAILLSIFVLMSQNRQAVKDRLMLNNDYFVNVRTEVELRKLTDVLKAARFVEWSNEMYALQKKQLEIIQNIAENSKK